MSKKVSICLAVPGRAATLIFYATNFCVEHRMPGTKQKRSGPLRKGGSLFRLLLLQHPRRSLRPQGGKGVLVASGVYEPGAVQNTSAMAQAYEMGRKV